MIGIVILSGGQGKRMGGIDKGLALHQGQSFFETVLQQLMPQAADLQNLTGKPIKFFVSANRNLPYYQSKLIENQLQGQVIPDCYPQSLGPMAGIVSVMKSDQHVQRWLFCPVDCLVLPKDYLTQLYSENLALIRYLKANNQVYPTHLSLPNSCLDDLARKVEKGHLSLKRWLTQTSCRIELTIEAVHHPYPLINLNHSCL